MLIRSFLTSVSKPSTLTESRARRAMMCHRKPKTAYGWSSVPKGSAEYQEQPAADKIRLKSHPFRIV